MLSENNMNINLKSLAKTISELPPLNLETAFVTPEIKSKIQKDIPASAQSFFGIKIHVKENQKMAGWFISDSVIAEKYLAGEITEADLVKMVIDKNKTVGCITN